MQTSAAAIRKFSPNDGIFRYHHPRSRSRSGKPLGLGYITYELDVPDSAFKIIDDLYSAIAKLNLMPKRFRIIPREPWQSRGVRFMFVDNYRIHYIVDDRAKTVTVFSVMYCRADS